MFYEVCITKHHAGFGMWQAGEANGEGWADDSDLIAEMAQNSPSTLYELGRDELPAAIEDIRGKISQEPARLFAYLVEDHGEERPYYCGITEKGD